MRVGEETAGEIGAGLFALVGVGREDDESDACLLAERSVHLRICDDGEGLMNLSLLDTGGSLLVVSQFTLLADSRRGRRPSFVAAARPEVAEPLVEAFASRARELGVRTAGGRFGAHMMIEMVADGPVTVMLDSKEKRRG